MFYKYHGENFPCNNLYDGYTYKYLWSGTTELGMLYYVLEDHVGHKSQVYKDVFDSHFNKSGMNEVNWRKNNERVLLGDNTNVVDNSNTKEKVEHPSHYMWLKNKWNIEVIDIARHLDFNLGNVLKYILRSGRKTEEGYTLQEKGLEDLKKALFYLQDEIKMLEENNKAPLN